MAKEALRIVDPLVQAATSPVQLEILLARHGWDVQAVIGVAAANLASKLADIEAEAQNVARLLVEQPATMSDAEARLASMRSLSRQVASLADVIPVEAAQLPIDILQDLLLRQVRSRSPLLFAALRALFLVDDVTDPQIAVDGRLLRREIERSVLRASRLGNLLDDPIAYLKTHYLPETLATTADAAAASPQLFGRIADLLREVGVESLVGSGLDPGGLSPQREQQLAAMLTVIRRFPTEGGFADVGATASLVAGDAGGPGFFVSPLASAQLTLEQGRWRIDTRVSGADLSGALITRDAVTFATPDAAGELGFMLVASRLGADGPQVVLGGNAGLRLEIGRVNVSVEGRFAEGRVEYGLLAEASSAAFVLAAGEGDGFLRQVLPPDGLRANFDLAVGWSNTKGLYFGGGASLDATLPLRLSLGPVSLPSLHLTVRTGGTGIPVLLTASARANLGPVRVTIDRIGLKANLTFPPSGGNLAVANLELAFKPPDGVGLSIDAGAVTGGGFLVFDPVREQYGGALHLDVEGGLALSAFGLLTTRMPDGSPGFSLLILIQASGFAPVPLGFGFNLTGVGGLLGVNRTVNIDVLRAGLRERTLDAILFSQEDPTPRAPQVVSALQSVFPPASDQYLFGPMVQIAWGPPPNPLLTIEVALILELPAPVRLIVLGRVQASLPTHAHAIVKLHLDVVGVIDFDRRKLAVDGTLYDSFVGPFALTGEMAARASWGDQPDFAVALGGFHPAFRPPEGFPQLRRLALTLSSGNSPRLRMEAYLALTSNTVQIGARLDFYVATAGFSLEGGFGFDTLITLSPFRLQAEIDTGLTLKQGSTTLAHLGVHVNLVGPAPWEVWGTATLSILCLDIRLPFHATFGELQALPEPERVDVWTLLKAQLAHPDNWATALPHEGNRLATLVAAPGQGDALVHPLGAVSVTQRLVPLERTLSLFGTAPPAEADFFEITGGTGLVRGDDVYDYFAPAQFRRMSDAEKLSSPSFDRMVSGATFGPRLDDVTIGTVAVAPLDYETALVIDLEDPTRLRSETYRPPGDTVATVAGRGPAALAEMRDQGREKFASPAPGPALAEPEYVVTTQDTLAEEVDGHDGTYSGAVEALRLRPDAERFQIVRREEVELAAL